MKISCTIEASWPSFDITAVSWTFMSWTIFIASLVYVTTYHYDTGLFSRDPRVPGVKIPAYPTSLCGTAEFASPIPYMQMCDGLNSMFGLRYMWYQTALTWYYHAAAIYYTTIKPWSWISIVMHHPMLENGTWTEGPLKLSAFFLFPFLQVRLNPTSI